MTFKFKEFLTKLHFQIAIRADLVFGFLIGFVIGPLIAWMAYDHFNRGYNCIKGQCFRTSEFPTLFWFLWIGELVGAIICLIIGVLILRHFRDYWKAFITGTNIDLLSPTKRRKD